MIRLEMSNSEANNVLALLRERAYDCDENAIRNTASALTCGDANRAEFEKNAAYWRGCAADARALVGRILNGKGA